eukprot:2021356-Pyramimonas_sp.AAC.1
MDVELSPNLDIARRRIFREILRWIKSGLTRFTWFWNPCTNWGATKSSPSAPDDIRDQRAVAT